MKTYNWAKAVDVNSTELQTYKKYVKGTAERGCHCTEFNSHTKKELIPGKHSLTFILLKISICLKTPPFKRQNLFTH
jgi:hypothetical protein